MQWVRSDYRNPIVQFIVTITNPLVAPLQKFVAPIYKLDTATLLVLVLAQWAVLFLLTFITCINQPDAVTMLGLATVRAVRLMLNVYFYVVFGYVLLSWLVVGGVGANPSLGMLNNLLTGLAQPILAPVRKFIPPIGGLDLSPLFLLLILGAMTNAVIPSMGANLAAGSGCPVAGIL